MKIYRQDKILDFCDHVCSGNCRRVGCNCECGEWHDEKPHANFEEQWAAEETIGEGLLKYREVVWSDTKMGAITKMLIKIHGNNLTY